MINWINTPLDDVIQSVSNLYGELNCDIVFDPELRNRENVYGLTNFFEDGTILIELDTESSLNIIVETLAHELAHVVAGVDAEHGDKWEEVFENIFVEYERYCKEKYKENY